MNLEWNMKKAEKYLYEKKEKISKMKLSVIMPVYNAADYLEASINSILNQDYEEFELIIVNDGSTDESEKICKKYADNTKIRYFYQENKGAQLARQYAIEMASGDLITFVDADDMVGKHMYRLLVDALIEYEADFAACGYIKKIDESLDDKAEFQVVTGAEDIISSIYHGCSGYLWNKVYRKKCMKYADFYPNIFLGEDGLFNLQMAKHLERIVLTKSRLYFYRQSPSSFTKTRTRGYDKWKEEVDAYKKMYELEKGSYLERYINMMLIHCIVKTAEASLLEKNTYSLLKELQEIGKSINMSQSKMRNTKILYKALLIEPKMYILIKCMIDYFERCISR